MELKLTENLKLSQDDQDFLEGVFSMDPETAAYLTGGHIHGGEKIAFRAWMMVMLDVIQHGVEAIAKYEAPEDAIEAYGRAYMPEAFRVRESVRRRADPEPDPDPDHEEDGPARASAGAALLNTKRAAQTYGRTGTEGPQTSLPRN